ncbi:gas vesicle protein [Yinghuangia seranimata]|uniref:gas vesicle protein GvpO n=1 Tax=Yinghuangia seranimata TaxID=408067 RepID=UPI00248CC3F1|nr:gas vesicle protein [Yinghuangia seranimata]MDI2125417.1 gas vesicle protein [Yinghuangia seranimata]
MPERTPRRSTDARSGGRAGARASGASRSKRPAAREIARQALEYVGDLVNRPVDGVSGLLQNENGWHVRIDVVEVPRVPDTTSLMATYELRLDRDGELVEYERVARFRRSDTDG